ncbi:type 2 DNA topoisomerase 6 subunit B-like [Hemitrygon akajei]|uniref:type 2 DNA topoisomerase 6 subunit B-like n=1 Tax=Hemitrygon akajei TaxID=2704970 RepID=UPI003BF9BADD
MTCVQRLYIAGGQQIVVEHLDQILNCNKEVVRECIQPVLRKVLDEYVQLRKNQRRVQTATHIIYDAIQSIVSCSTNHGFRTRSLQLLQVSHTQEMKTSLQSLLQNVIQNRFLSSRGCNIKQVQSDDGDRANSSSDSAIPEASQENLCETDNFQMIYSEPEGSVSGTRKRQLEMNTTNPCMNRSSRPPKQTTDEVCHQPRTEHVSTALVSSLKTNTQLSASGPTRSASDGQGSNVSTREKAIADQEDFLWLQEVHNLTEWT